MARTTITLNYTGSSNGFCADIVLDKSRRIRRAWNVGQTLDITDIASAEELNRNAALAALIAAGKFTVTFTSGTSDVVAPINTGDIASNTITPIKLADNASSSSATGIGVPFVIYKNVTAGAGGSADDVMIYTADAPFKFRVLDAWAIVTTVAGTTLDVRSATAAGGTKMTGTIATGTAGTFRAAGTTPTSSSTIAADGSLVLRRGDSGFAGHVFIMCMREE